MAQAIEIDTNTASRVLVIAGSEYNRTDRRANEVLANVTDAGMIAALGRALAATPSDAALMTPGDPTIVILNGEDVLHVVHLVGQTHVRCEALWDADARLDQPAVVADWVRLAIDRT